MDGHSPTVGLLGVALQRALERADREADRERAGLRADAAALGRGQQVLTFAGPVHPPAIGDDYGEPT